MRSSATARTGKSGGTGKNADISSTDLYEGLRDSPFVELLIVILLISIFITFASVNWNVATKKGKEALLEDFSINVAMIREDAISHYENRVLEFDVSNGEVHAGRLDAKNVFVETGLLHLPEDYRIKDLVINGEAFSAGEVLHDLLRERDGGQDPRPSSKEARTYYSLLINPLTAKVTGENGYIEEISVKDRNNPS